MSIFEYRKPSEVEHPRDQLGTLRSILTKLDAQSKPTPQMADLRRILAGRIAELERKTG